MCVPWPGVVPYFALLSSPPTPAPHAHAFLHHTLGHLAHLTTFLGKYALWESRVGGSGVFKGHAAMSDKSGTGSALITQRPSCHRLAPAAPPHAPPTDLNTPSPVLPEEFAPKGITDTEHMPSVVPCVTNTFIPRTSPCCSSSLCHHYKTTFRSRRACAR